MKKNDLSSLTEATRRALSELLSLFDDRIYEWLAGLYDPAVGGFYYSASARDHEGFLPDLESTGQAMHGIKNLGLADSVSEVKEVFTPEMRERIIRFVQNMQDTEDGFFYHPQWGKRIVPSRKGRDLNWAKGILDFMSAKPLYPLPDERIKAEGVASAAMEERFSGEEEFLRYLASFDLRTTSYRAGNTVGSQFSQINAAGLADVMLRYFTERQLPENGIWQEEITYSSVNGLMKISGIYPMAKKPFPNAERAIETAIEGQLLTEIPTAVVDVFNPWASMTSIISSQRQYGDPELADRLQAKIIDRAPELIRRTAEKISAFRKADGSFSYNPKECSCVSQMAPVALRNENEGDVNATMISVNGTAMRILRMLGVPSPALFGREDTDRFRALLKAQTPPVKRPAPEGRMPELKQP